MCMGVYFACKRSRMREKRELRVTELSFVNISPFCRRCFKCINAHLHNVCSRFLIYCHCVSLHFLLVGGGIIVVWFILSRLLCTVHAFRLGNVCLEADKVPHTVNKHMCGLCCVLLHRKYLWSLYVCKFSPLLLVSEKMTKPRLPEIASSHTHTHSTFMTE